MKTVKKLIILSIAGITATACNGTDGSWSKNPAPDINQIRASKKTEGQEGPQRVTEYVIKEVPVEVKMPVYVDKEVPVPVEKVVYVDKEVPVPVEKIVYVDKEVPVIKEQATIDDKYVVISADPAMKFMEGQKSSFKILGRSLLPGLKVDLKISELPKGATFKKVSETDIATYELSWAPTVDMIPSNEVYKTFDLKVSAQVVEAPKGRDKNAIQKLLREKEVTVFILRSQKGPSDVIVEGLGQQVSEGELTPFAITATVHGLDDKSGQKPTLKITYDQISSIAGSNLLELNGTKHIIADQAQMDPVYMGDFKWKFHLLFDTKNVAVQPALTKTGKLAPSSEYTPVRMSFKVTSPFGADSPEILKQLKIQRTTAFVAPQFDFSGMNSETLELTPGETKTVTFAVQSAQPLSTTKVEVKNISTLKGSPNVTCTTSSKAKSRQECTLTWNVPCNATNSDLTQSISMSAVTTIDGKNTDPTAFTLKTSRSKEAAKNCTKTGAKP